MIYSLAPQLKTATDYVQNRVKIKPEIALILGSGLGFFAENIDQSTVISYEDIPHFPQSTVEGHAGQLVFGEWRGNNLVIAQGRQHFYEGYSLDEVTFATRIFNELGAGKLIITNAAGCINPDYAPGEFMTITNHFPMVHQMLTESYQDITPAETWDIQTSALLRDYAVSVGITLRNGTYAWVTGPSYETPAEIRYLRQRGADAVGMSTVPEAIAAAKHGMNVVGVSCFTNYAAGLSTEQLSHGEVQQTAERVREPFIQLVKKLITMI
jgi:purine-nucleoside phosphorylase